MRPCTVIPMPSGPAERLAASLRNYLHLPDPGALYTLMGAVAANCLEGSPVWLMLVGPPSCGKTELLNSLLTVPGIVEAADIASEAAFLSGTPAKDTAKNATGGLLREVGQHGGLILNDFTSVLSKPMDKIAGIMAVLREAYGGRWTRHIGGEGGRTLTWTGKIGVFAGCTSKIDQHHQISSELGERWIYWRYEPGDCFAECMLALSNDRNGWREDLRRVVQQFFEDQDLHFGTTIPRRNFTDAERLRIYGLASFAVKCRSGVARDHFTREIIGARESELGTRLATVLGQLLLGMDRIGVSEPTRWRLLAKVATDSMPRLRKLAIDAIASVRHGLLIDDIRQALLCSKTTASRVIEDLEVHEIVVREFGRIQLTKWATDSYNRFVRG